MFPVNPVLISITREVLHMHSLRDIFLPTRSLPPPPRRTPSFLVSCPFLSHETTRRASPASSLRLQTYFHALTRYACLPNHRTILYLSPPPLRFLGGLTTAQGAITPAALALLLRDAATLLRPPLVAVAEVEGEWECVPALRALSDLHALFKPRSPRTAAKIMFYAAQVHCVSSSASFLLRGLQADVERWAMKLEKEEDEEEDEKRRGAGADHGIPMTTTETRKIVLDRPPPNERPSIIEL